MKTTSLTTTTTLLVLLALETAVGASFCSKQLEHGVTLQWSALHEDLISVKVTRSEQAWLGVGLGDRNDSFIVGLPDLGDTRVLPLGEDMTSSADPAVWHHAAETEQDSPRIQQGHMQTSLSLTLPLDVDHIYVASGSDNTFGPPAFVLSVSLSDTTDCDLAESSPRVLQGSRTANQNLWKAHGILMTAAWALLIPLGVTASFIRQLLTGDSWWFHIHRALNSLAVLCIIAGFVLAFYAIHQEDDQSHFRETDHRAIGVTAMWLAIIQAIMGYARPQRKLEEVVLPEEKEASPQQQDGIEPTNEQEKPDDDDDEEPELSNLRKVWALQHRLLGLALIGICWYNIHRGIDLYEDRFGDILKDRSTTAMFWGGMVGFVVSVAVLVTIARSFT